VSSVASQAEHAPRQPDAIGLEPVPETGLGDALSVLQLNRQPPQVRDQIGIDAREVAGDHAAEQDPTEPGRRIHGQPAPAEGDPSGRGHRT
jgi:hypothetical protein